MINFLIDKKYRKNPIIHSNNFSLKWNSLYDPHIFGFITDLHITSSFYPQRLIDTESMLKIFNESGVEKVLIAGDICENYDSKYFKFGHQTESDYISYSKIENQYPTDFIIVASGNHDEFGVENYDSKDHYILQYCNFYSKNKEKFDNYENFLISKVYINDIELFVMNPYIYPTPRGGIGYSMRFTTSMLDHIEKVISEPIQSNATIRLFMTHSPLCFSNSWVKSTSQKSLIEILTSKNITAFLIGHTHANRIVHRNESIEIQSISVKDSIYKGRGYNFISVDNGGVSYHSFNLKNNDKPVAVLTYPIEKKLLSKMSDFSFENFNQTEIRVVHFSEKNDVNISVTCDMDNGNIKSDFLQFQRIIRKNESLYSIPLKKVCQLKNERKNDFIEFRLTFSGDWNYSSEFVVGNSVKLDKEPKENDTDVFVGIAVVGFIFWIFILFIWSPIPPPKYCDEVNMLICNCGVKSLKNIFGLIFGPIVIKSRIYHNISFKTRILYFVICLMFIYMPMCFVKIGENEVGFIIFFGYYLVTFSYDFWGQVLFGFFSILILIPSTIVFSSISQMSQTIRFSFVFVFDILFAIFQIFGILIGSLNVVHMSTSKILSFTSPLFGITPLIIMYLEFVEFKKMRILRLSIYEKLDENEKEKVLELSN